MKLVPGPSAASVHSRGAFTIIELLAVMAIILVLAGLIISIAGSAQYNSARARATAEIKAMETALESYKTDNGAYPSDSTNVNTGSTPTTEVLDAQNVSLYADPATYTNSSEFLYQALSGFQASSANGGGGLTFSMAKAYMTFKPDQLHLAANSSSGNPAPTIPTPTSPYMYIIDPFGFSYGYSTIYAAKQTANNAASPPVTTPITNGYNPTFDLWSTAGYANGGKSTPNPTPAGGVNTLWVKNW